MAKPDPILGEEWGRSLAEALGIDPDLTSRIVIDIRPRELIKVYVEKIATERLLDVLPPSIEWCEIETNDGPTESEESRQYWMAIRLAKQGEKCCFCGHEYTNTNDIIERDVIPVLHDPNRFKIACKACYEKNAQ